MFQNVVLDMIHFRKHLVVNNLLIKFLETIKSDSSLHRAFGASRRKIFALRESRRSLSSSVHLVCSKLRFFRVSVVWRHIL